MVLSSVSARHESGEDIVRLDFDKGERLFQSSASSSLAKVNVPVIQVMHEQLFNVFFKLLV